MVGMETRTALLDAAENAARAQGFDGFSYADLAVAVGIRKASIHYHFPTKADLALALIERYAIRFFEALDQIVADQPSGAARLKSYVALCRAALSGGEQLCLCIVFSAGRDSLSAEVLTKVDAFHMTVALWLTETFALGQQDQSITGVGDPHQEAQACLAQMEGAQLIARAAKDVSRFDAAVAGLLRRV
jgi:TetR/AcrR family transcriptional regulator, transcriptional repressor for nem operon